MRVPADIRKCVAFLAYRASSGEVKLAGTAFFASEPIPDSRYYFQWIATAAHVINGIEATSSDGIVRVRVNVRDGGTRWIDIPTSQWMRHPTSDVAVAPLDLDATTFDFLFYALSPGGIATAERIAEEEIGPGDEVFLTGLFVHHTGLERNVPIIRVGNIAAMPSEPIALPMWGQMPAYLIEARSIGGLSGSPVFVHMGLIRIRDGQLLHARSPHGAYMLLGVTHGHYDAGLAEADMPSEERDARERVNMGIAVVTPVEKLIEVMNDPSLADLRAQTIASAASDSPAQETLE